MSTFTLLALALPAGVVLDRLLGEPRRWHPLAGFGRAVALAEGLLRRGAPGHPLVNRLAGLLAWALLVLPPAALAFWAQGRLGLWLHIPLLYFALGARSLEEHALAVARPLAAGDLPQARRYLSWIVSRNTEQLDEEAIARATVETVLENGNDAVFATLFWFCLGGGAGALLFRLANTLDAMWGYKDQRRIYFGWAAARMDDLLGLIPARLTALSYTLLGRTASAWRCWRSQGGQWSSPNAGPVMAAGAGALGISVGGNAVYHGREEVRPVLGTGPRARAGDIVRALDLVRRGLWLWLVLAILAGIVTGPWPW